MNFFERFINSVIEDRSFKRAHEMELKRMDLEHEESLIEKQTTCQSCETLKLEIAKLHDQNNTLLQMINIRTEPEKVQDMSELKPILPKQHMNWNSRRQMLEAADREKAHVMRQHQLDLQNKVEVKTNGTTMEPLSVSQIESELGIDVNTGENHGN